MCSFSKKSSVPLPHEKIYFEMNIFAELIVSEKIAKSVIFFLIRNTFYKIISMTMLLTKETYILIIKICG